MRERLALLREYLKNRLAFGKNKKTRKGFILTMVALVEVLAISVVSVSAWVETISTITIKAEGAKIDNYVYTNADIGSGDGYSGKTIDLTKYFRAAGGVHLASASSADGENIFFPIKNSGASEFGVDSYRCADVNDKNVNYIDFSFNVKVDKIKADHAEFYLDQVPKITIGGGNVSGNLVRMAITDTDTQNTVVCGSNASEGNVVNTADGKEVPDKVQAFSDFVVSSESIPTELFRVDRGSSKTINIKVWLQDDDAATEYAGKTVSITDVNIVTQNKKGNKVYFVDRTVNDNKKNWTENVKFQQGSEASVPMNYDAKSHTYYCNYKTATDDTKVKFTSGSVTWSTDMKSLNSGNSMYYTAYGDHNSSNAGYGTWGEVIEISVSSNATNVLPNTGNVSSVYMFPDKNDTNSKVRMPFTNDKNKWVGYIAKEKADDMTFSFKNNNINYEIPAPNRGNSTLFVVTSATTGYWDPPATITVTAGKNDAGEPKVSYDSLTSTTISVTPGTRVKLEANPKTGFVLKNWVISGTSTVADGIDSNGYFTPTASGNYNFTADYAESMTFEAYVRTYDGRALSDSTNGGKVKIVCGNQTPTDEEYTDETHITLNAVKGSTVTYYAKANDGYVFDGWYTDADCNSVPENSSDKYELANVQDSKRLYAKFKVDTYTVEAYTQYGNEVPFGSAGKVSFDNKAYNSQVTTTVSRNGKVTFYAKPEKGYAFIGWYESKDATDPKVAVKDCILDKDKGVYSKEMTIQYSDVKTYPLYARFKALYTVEAKAMYNNENVIKAGTVKVDNEKADKISSKPVMEGENVTVTASANNGYKFAGWYTDEICSKPYFKENNNVSPITLNKVSEGITLYAKFELKTNVTFYLNDGGLWSGDKAKLAAYVWDDNGNKKWLEVSKTDYDNYYSFALDNNQWKQVIFVRYDPSKNLNDFPTEDWNGYVWNKTSDITIDYNNNCYVITSSPNNGGSSTGYWTSYTPGKTANIDIYVYTGNCSWFDHDSAVLAYRFSTDDSFKSDCTKVTKDGKPYWKLSIPTDKDTIYLSRAALGGHHNEFNTSIDKSKNLFTVNNDFNGGDWSTY